MKKFTESELNAAKITPYTLLLNDNQTTATIYPIALVDSVPRGLLEFVCDEFNGEIIKGTSFPFLNPFPVGMFSNYWFGWFSAVIVLGDDLSLFESSVPRQWEKECLGAFTIKPNYPGRSSHVCTGSFITNIGVRNRGIGCSMMDAFMEWAAALGFTYALFDLIYASNSAMTRVFVKKKYKRLGTIPGGASLKDQEIPDDVAIFGKQLHSSLTRQRSLNEPPQILAPENDNRVYHIQSSDEVSKDTVRPQQVVDDNNAPKMITMTVNETNMLRLQNIKYYLLHGQYPPYLNRNDKNKIRAALLNYRLLGEKMMLKNKEVVIDPEEQVKIVNKMHLLTEHGGINRTTSMVTERYHWMGVKDIVKQFIQGCSVCVKTKSGDKKDKKKMNKDKTDGNVSEIQPLPTSSHNESVQNLGKFSYIDHQDLNVEQYFNNQSYVLEDARQVKRQKLSDIQFGSDDDDSEYSEASLFDYGEVYEHIEDGEVNAADDDDEFEEYDLSELHDLENDNEQLEQFLKQQDEDEDTIVNTLVSSVE